jgi:hypothetical protein
MLLASRLSLLHLRRLLHLPPPLPQALRRRHPPRSNSARLGRTRLCGPPHDNANRKPLRCAK